MLDKPRINGYKKCDLLNGDGICISVWFQGCKFRCKGCHNPQTWSLTASEEFTQDKVEEIKRLLDDKYVDGLSLLGGEPLLKRNYEIILQLTKYAKSRNKTVYLWTGYNWGEIEDYSILEYVDYVVCGRYMEELRKPTKYCGSLNQEVIDVNKSLKTGIKTLKNW